MDPSSVDSEFSDTSFYIGLSIVVLVLLIAFCVMKTLRIIINSLMPSEVKAPLSAIIFIDNYRNIGNGRFSEESDSDVFVITMNGDVEKI